MARRKFVQDVGILTITNLAIGALLAVQGIVVIRVLGPTDFGVAALIMTVGKLVFRFFDAHSAEATVKYLSEFMVQDRPDKARSMCQFSYLVDFGISTFALLVTFAVADWAAINIVHRAGAAGLVVLYAAAYIPNSLSTTSKAVFRSLERFTLIAIVTALLNVFRTALVIGLVVGGLGVAGVIWANTIALVVQGLVWGVLAHHFVIRTWGRSWMTASWTALSGARKEILRFLIYTDLNTLVGIAVKELDLLVLGYFAGATQAGFYRFAHSLQAVLNGVTSPLQAVVYPRLARMAGAAEVGRLHRTIRRYAIQIGVPLFLLVVVAILLLPFIIPFLAGEATAPAVPIAQILFLNGGMALTLFWLRPFFFAVGRVRYWLFLGVLNGLFALLAYPAGAILAGGVGVAVARVLAGVVRYGPGTWSALRWESDLPLAKKHA